jgi:hypothetical protein
MAAAILRLEIGVISIRSLSRDGQARSCPASHLPRLADVVGRSGQDKGMRTDLAGLGPAGFERLCQALAVYVLGPGIEVFGAGPDGGPKRVSPASSSTRPRPIRGTVTEYCKPGTRAGGSRVGNRPFRGMPQMALRTGQHGRHRGQGPWLTRQDLV